MQFRLNPSMLALVLAAIAGCRAAAPAAPATPAAPTLPTSASAGGTSIVAIAPPSQACCPKQTLPQFLGITGACEGVKGLLNRLRNRLGAIWPGLEAQPEILALADPKNLDSANPAVASAAGVKAEEDGAAQKAKAIAYLASVGCAGCYPGIEEALLEALDDCTELVRFETVKALRSTANMPCKNCCRGACCGPKIREKLEKLAYEMDEQGCYLELSDRVRRMARLALAHCNCVPLKPSGQKQTLPQEGPGAEAVPPPAATATASVLRPPGSPAVNSASIPIGSGVTAMNNGTTSSPPAARQVSYDEALRAYTSRDRTGSAEPLEVAFEAWTARPGDFASREEAVTAMTLARVQIMSSQPGQYLPPQLVRHAHDWMDAAKIDSPAVARAAGTMPVGGVSGVLEDRSGWHLIRVLARRPAPAPTPATSSPLPPNGAQLPVTPTQAATVPGIPHIVAVRVPDCNCK
jgi:hypothetical protein